MITREISENEREREEVPERKRRGQNVEIQSEFTLRIIIPQTIRSIIRVYLLWRGSIQRR